MEALSTERPLRQFHRQPVAVVSDPQCGCSARCPDVVKRIDEQMTGTSMPERAKLLLVFRVPNGPIAEKAFHAALKSKGRHINEAVGKEWFKKGKGDIEEGKRGHCTYSEK
jgi:hypothetical protein